VQVAYQTGVTSDTYVKQRAWQKASLQQCPLHPQGGCGLARHGTYCRSTVPGVRVARWYCRKAKTTISLLPSFLAARLAGTLDEVEEAVAASEGTLPLEVVAGQLRPDIELPGALRWLRRRRNAVSVALLAAVTLVPALGGCDLSIKAVRDRLGTTSALVELRRLCSGQLAQMAAPIGFAHHRPRRDDRAESFQHKTGADPPS